MKNENDLWFDDFEEDDYINDEDEFDSELDRRWREKFGEPRDRVFTTEEFIKWMDDIINFK